MSTYTAHSENSIGTERLEGPIPEIDKYGNLTGYTFWRCRNCGREAMRKRDLEHCCRR